VGGGDPWTSSERSERLWSASPLKDAARVRTPMLIFTGELDGRVPPAQALEFYRALVAQRVEARLFIAPREGHQWGELRHQLRKANLELEWFERRLRQRDDTWENAPGDPNTASR
jgi:dipeptidyl aminopeptidase/acylaminoacyl peptidase